MCGIAVERTFVVTMIDDTLPNPRVHQVQVNSPCGCDLEEFVRAQPDLPFEPYLVLVDELLEPLSRSSRLSY